MKIKAAVFDLDGTLLRTEKFHWMAWNVALGPHKKEISREEYYKYAGKHGDEIEKILCEKYLLKIKKGEMLKVKERQVKDWFAQGSLKRMPGAKEAVDYFSLRKIPVAVATSCPRDEMEEKLKQIGAQNVFNVKISVEDVKNAKPAPDIYALACEKMNSNPSETVAFEDTDVGVRAAVDAGLYVVAIPNEFTQGQDFSAAKIIAKDFDDAMQKLVEAKMIEKIVKKAVPFSEASDEEFEKDLKKFAKERGKDNSGGGIAG